VNSDVLGDDPYRRFGWTCCLHLQGRRGVNRYEVRIFYVCECCLLGCDAVYSGRYLPPILYQNTRRYIPEDSNLQKKRYLVQLSIRSTFLEDIWGGARRGLLRSSSLSQESGVVQLALRGT
jgi:hypothetical protein